MKSIWPSLPAPFVRAMLASHSAAGLFFAALAYLVCLTGTLAVFTDEFRRWEEPHVAEGLTYDPAAVARAAEHALNAAGGADVHAVVMRLPSPEWPRMTASLYGEAIDRGWYVTATGELAAPHAPVWSEFLREIHASLNLPGMAGYLIVGLVGVGMLALAISGVLAHPRIFRDAFALRWGGSRRLQEADLHNRLSVWGLPFNLAICATGAYFGLVGLLMMLVADIAYDGGMEPLLADISPPHPEENNIPAPFPDIVGMLAKVAADPLRARAFSLFVEHPRTAGWHAGVYAKVEGSLSYGELFHFRADGEGRLHYVDGSAGQQAYIAAYPLHFGDFGGLPVKLLYGALGLGLTVICAGGISIWLARRRGQGRPVPAVERLWPAAVWSVPLSLAISAALAIALSLPPLPVFWIAVSLSVCAPMVQKDAATIARGLRAATAVALLTAVALHVSANGVQFAGTAIWINAAALCVAAMLLMTAIRRTRSMVVAP